MFDLEFKCLNYDIYTRNVLGILMCSHDFYGA